MVIFFLKCVHSQAYFRLIEVDLGIFPDCWLIPFPFFFSLFFKWLINPSFWFTNFIPHLVTHSFWKHSFRMLNVRKYRPPWSQLERCQPWTSEEESRIPGSEDFAWIGLVKAAEVELLKRDQINLEEVLSKYLGDWGPFEKWKTCFFTFPSHRTHQRRCLFTKLATGWDLQQWSLNQGKSVIKSLQFFLVHEESVSFSVLQLWLRAGFSQWDILKR